MVQKQPKTVAKITQQQKDDTLFQLEALDQRLERVTPKAAEPEPIPEPSELEAALEAAEPEAEDAHDSPDLPPGVWTLPPMSSNQTPTLPPMSSNQTPPLPPMSSNHTPADQPPPKPTCAR